MKIHNNKQNITKELAKSPSDALFCHDGSLPSGLKQRLDTAHKKAGYTLIDHQINNISQLRKKAGLNDHALILIFMTPDNSSSVTELLKAHKASDSKTSIVVIADHPGEELVADIVKFGASDYVDSHNMERLSEILTDLSSEFSTASANDRLHHNLSRFDDLYFKKLIEASNEWIWTINQDNEHTFSNSAVESILGYTVEELLDKPAGYFMHEEDAKSNAEKLSKLIKSGSGWKNWVLRWHHKDGSIRYLESSASPLTNEMGELTGYIGIDHDITQRIEQSTTNQRLMSILEATPDLVAISDKYGKTLYLNKAGRKLMGFGEKEDLSNISIAEYHNKETADFVLKTGLPQSVADGIWSNETLFTSRHGKNFLTSQILQCHKSTEGEAQYFSTIARDITDQRNSELARLENETLLKTLLHTATDGIAVINDEGIIHSVNPSIETMFGYKPGELIGRNINLLMPEPHKSQHNQYIQNYCNTGEAKIIDTGREAEGLHKDGSVFPIDLLVNKMTIGDKVYFTGFVRDITEQKQAEEKLAEANAEWNYAMDFFDEAIYLLDLDRHIVSANKAFYKLTQSEGKDIIGQHITSIIHPQGEEIPCPVCRAQEEKHDLLLTMEKDHPDNPTDKPIEVICKIIRGKDNQPRSILMSVRDLSPLRKTDELIRNSETNLAEAQRIARIGNWVWNIQNGDLTWSDEIYRIFGRAPQQFKATYDAFLQTIHPEDRNKVQESVNQALHMMKPYSIEHRIVLPDNSTRYVHEQAEVRLDDEANPLRMIGTVQDITDRVFAEKALKKSEIRFRSTFEQAAVGMAHVSPTGQWLMVNQRLCNIAGYSHEELMNLTFQDVIHPDDFKNIFTAIGELLNGKINSYSNDIRYIRKDKSISWVNLTSALVRKENHEADFLIMVIEDINARKTAEFKIQENLYEKDALLRELHHRVKNNMQIISSMISLQARYINDNKIREALNESRQRIRTMALVHERLYSSVNLGDIDFLDYLKHLTKRIIAIYEHDNRGISIDISGESLKFSVDKALPIALIINELVVNSIKHAYAMGVHHHIEIELNRIQENVEIQIRDFGRGFDHEASNDADSLGLTIITALSKQIGATIEFNSSNDGTVAKIIISPGHYNNSKLH